MFLTLLIVSQTATNDRSRNHWNKAARYVETDDQDLDEVGNSRAFNVK